MGWLFFLRVGGFDVRVGWRIKGGQASGGAHNPSSSHHRHRRQHPSPRLTLNAHAPTRPHRHALDPHKVAGAAHRVLAPDVAQGEAEQRVARAGRVRGAGGQAQRAALLFVLLLLFMLLLLLLCV
jgi:hypothetical protein